MLLTSVFLALAFRNGYHKPVVQSPHCGFISKTEIVAISDNIATGMYSVAAGRYCTSYTDTTSQLVPGKLWFITNRNNIITIPGNAGFRKI